MTRRKDTLRNKTEIVRIAKQKGNSRIEKQLQKKRENEEEKWQEKNILLKVANLPDELIRLVYAFMGGKAKLIFYPKYDSLSRAFDGYDFQIELETLFGKMTNTQLLDLVYTGTLLKYPEIVGALRYDYYYSLIDQDFHTVFGYELLNLWATERLSYDFVRAEYSMNEEMKREIDTRIKERIASAIQIYISNVLHDYRIARRNLSASSSSSLDHDKATNNYRDIVLDVEKAAHLYRVASRFISRPEPDTRILVQVQGQSQDMYPFTNELLIPVPMSI